MVFIFLLHASTPEKFYLHISADQRGFFKGTPEIRERAAPLCKVCLFHLRSSALICGG